MIIFRPQNIYWNSYLCDKFQWEKSSRKTEEIKEDKKGTIIIMAKLLEINFNAGDVTPKEINVLDFIPESIQKTIIEGCWGYGIDIQIIAIKEVEHFIESKFAKEGYKVIRTQWHSVDKTLEQLHKEGLVSSDLLQSCKETGVPDYFCFKNKDDWFFVEGKNNNDGLRINQIIWICKHKFPTKLVYLDRSIGKVDELR